MEKIVVSYTEQVQLFFNELIAQLFYKDYFIYEENAIEYVQKLLDSLDIMSINSKIDDIIISYWDEGVHYYKPFNNFNSIT